MRYTKGGEERDVHHELIDEKLKNIDANVLMTRQYIEQEIREMREDQRESMLEMKEELKKKVSREEFNPYRAVVYALVGTSLMAILTAILKGVLKIQ
jgi:glucosamine 6-phosphate synthetase-like amidotransferase/phosphosugar isomerase protein